MGFIFHELPLSVAVVTLAVFTSWISVGSDGYIIGDNPNHRASYLDTQGNYYFEWKVDFNRKLITFNVTAGTTGYVLFGLANNGSATTGGDYVVAGVTPEGEPYFSDRYTIGNEIPQEDSSTQDYDLLDAWENKTHTHLSFSRSLDTCDRFDYPITDNKVTVIWGYGVTDDYETVRTYGVQGAFNVYLLDPEFSPRISRDRRLNGAPTLVTRDNLQLWTIRRQIVIPENTTSYICSIHKAPRLQRKHHLVGNDVYFHSQGSRRRVHHMIFYKCNVPGGGDPRPLFEPFEGGQGQTCYSPQRGENTGGPMPVHLCSELTMGWAVGGRAFFTPPHVGIPFGQESDEYYMVQLHYDNPDGRKGVVVDMRMDFFYTSYLRPNEGGMMSVTHEIPGLPTSILVPPSTPNQRIFGHCPAECTRRMLPPKGIKIYASFLHTHYSRKRARLRHFTDDEELPWIIYDDNYSNSYQDWRHLREEVSVLPGDQVTMECIYDSTWTNGSIVGGYSTTQEMCAGFFYYYTRINDYSYCRSEIRSDEYRQRFLGVSNVTWTEDLLEFVAEAPPNLAGLTMTEISDSYVDWDAGKRQELTRFHEAHPHVSSCSRDLSFWTPAQVQAFLASGGGALTTNAPTNVNTPNAYSGPGLYPFRARPYVPEQSCSYKGK